MTVQAAARPRKSDGLGRFAGLRNGIVRRVDYFTAGLTAMAVAQSWFVSGAYVATGDVAPFVRESLASSVTELWGYQLTGAGSPSYEIARILDVAILEIASAAGLGGSFTQRLLYTLLAAFAACSVVYLVAPFTVRRSIRAVAGITAVVNPYWMLLIPNPIFLWAITAGGLLGGLVLRATRGSPPKPWTAGLASVVLTPLAVNPPLVAAIVAWLGLLIVMAPVIAGIDGLRRVGAFLMRAVPWAFLVNAFWIVPAWFVLTRSAAVLAAETSPEVWSWSHAQNSISRVATLTAHWGWAFPESYYPYAPRLENPWFAWMRFVLPTVALISPLVTRGRARRLGLAMGAAVTVLVLIGKGLHTPLAGLNRWLYEQVPGMWLLREPMSKVGWMLLLIYLIGGVLTADRMVILVRRSGRWRKSLFTGLTVVVVATWAFAHPLWTGEAIPSERSGLPDAHVVVPDDWHRVAAAVNEADDDGTVLILPIASFYQMDHTWGFYGADEMVRQLIKRRVLQVSTGGYFSDPPAYREAARLAEAAILDGDRARALRLLESLGVSTIVVRRDFNPERSQGTVVDVKRLERNLAAFTDINPSVETTVASVWTTDRWRPRLFLTSNLVESDSEAPESIARVLMATDPGSALVPRGTTQAPSTEVRAWTHESSVTEMSLAAQADLTLEILPTAPYAWTATTVPQGLELMQRDRLLFDGKDVLPVAAHRYETSSPIRAITIDSRTFLVEDSVKFVASPGTPFTAYESVVASDLPFGDTVEVEDCNNYDERTMEQAGINLANLGDSISLEAGAHSACVHLPLPARSGGLLVVSVDADAIQGAPPRMCIYSTSARACVATEVLTKSSGALTAVVPAQPGLGLYLYADEPAPGIGTVTVANYATPTVEILETASVYRIPEAPLAFTLEGIPDGGHTVETRTTGVLPLAGFDELSPLEDCNRYDGKSPEEAGLRLTRLDATSVRLEAADHSACAWIPLNRLSTGAIAVSFDVLHVSGAAPRICLWMVGPDRCADLPPIGRSDGVHHYEAVTRPDPRADELRLYFYADAFTENIDARTVIEYRDLKVQPAAPWTVVISTRPTQDDSTVDLNASDRHSLVIGVSADDLPEGPLAVVLNDAYDEDWTMTTPAGGRHVKIDGWANGWIFDDSSALVSADVVLKYQPAAWSRRAIGVSAAAVLVALAMPGLISIKARVMRIRSAGRYKA